MARRRRLDRYPRKLAIKVSVYDPQRHEARSFTIHCGTDRVDVITSLIHADLQGRGFPVTRLTNRRHKRR